ncbi:hypothetical protein FAM09_04725 [Niastella caeni]|uniref:Uncharacterized protein n=1 Tax=Niastella caeni TaxID=2569763 RepID=A0A4S8I090_9BACT|nr:hypothetical protein [Niastella caeni]THU41417.1 hypothetical protein FAM09_04725 [Niastella caeni]
MRNAYAVLFSVALVFIVACNSQVKNEKEQGADPVAVTSPDRIDVSKTDSIELLYYPDPANQRVYDRMFIKDSIVIRLISNYILDTPAQKNACANDFKLFLFRNGEVYKTIYAATADSCRYFAYVINGVTHFTNLDDSARVLLKRQLKH